MIFQITAPQFARTLKNLVSILEKAEKHAETKKMDSSALLQSRLIADQFDLTRQIQIACDTAKLCIARVTNKEAPSHPDTEKTIPELKTRILSVVSHLENFSESDFSGAEERKVSQPRWEGKYLNGQEYVLMHAIPNFYFHVTTAYAILRHNGVDIGKKDYLGELPFKK